MKTFLQTAVVFVLLASSAFASKYTPNGGTATDPAPAGNYMGHVSRKVDGDQTTWRIKTADGVLEFDNASNDLTDSEKEALKVAEKQNDDNNTVEIDKRGTIKSVSTG